MARKTSTVTIDGDGRDKGKAFLLTEMPAAKAEKWAARAILALVRGGVTIPDNVASLGLAGLVIIGPQLLSSLDWDLAEPLLDEMFACVQIIPNTSIPLVVRTLIDDDIEEVKTRIFLRKAILELHIDFFTDAALLTQAREAVVAIRSNS